MIKHLEEDAAILSRGADEDDMYLFGMLEKEIEENVYTRYKRDWFDVDESTEKHLMWLFDRLGPEARRGERAKLVL